jgi:hypothetical protein
MARSLRRHSIAPPRAAAPRLAGALLVTALISAAVPAGFAREARVPELGSAHPQVQQNTPYDGRYTFVRVRYGGGRGGGFGFRGRGGGDDSWAHDYPMADLNMQLVLKEVTSAQPVTGTSVVVDLEDPIIFRYPILYMSEPGFWRVTPEGAQNLRTHLLKGGFIIFDDFDGPGHWEAWEAQMRQALPEYRPIKIDATHPVFRTFFYVEDIYVPHPMVRVTPEYLGIFEDNDPTKRMLALVNYNSDLAEYWEYAAKGFLAIDPTNDAYRLGVNYIIWGLTH